MADVNDLKDVMICRKVCRPNVDVNEIIHEVLQVSLLLAPCKQAKYCFPTLNNILVSVFFNTNSAAVLCVRFVK